VPLLWHNVDGGIREFIFDFVIVILATGYHIPTEVSRVGCLEPSPKHLCPKSSQVNLKARSGGLLAAEVLFRRWSWDD